MEYNDKWTREKFIEYRKLKRSGYTYEMLKEHFGDDIYSSGMYNKNSNILPWLEFITEIIITPENTDYEIIEKKSDIYDNKLDYIIRFSDNGNNYIISLFYFIIEGIETYNILLTTEIQWNKYLNKLNDIRYKGYITDNERNELIDIVERETGFNQLYSVMRRISYILFDVFNNKLRNNFISLGETSKIVKINLYRNIIKSSFPNVNEIGEKFDDFNNRYYIYKIQ